MGMSRPGFFDGIGVHGFPFTNHVFFGSLGIFVAVISFISAALAFTVGYSLLERKSWGRTLAMILAILQLIKIPFGTAIGIYTLWVLGPAASAAEYAAIADRT